MKKDYTAIEKNVSDATSLLLEALPEATEGLTWLAQHTKKAGTLSYRTKLQITLAIAINMRCDPCIARQARRLAETGASREEIAEVAGICLSMGGPPALTYAAGALEAFDTFSNNNQ